MRNTNLKPFQIDNLIEDTVRVSMTGNEGIALVKLRNNGFPDIDKLSKDWQQLNADLIGIELKAKKEMENKIKNYLNY